MAQARPVGTAKATTREALTLIELNHVTLKHLLQFSSEKCDDKCSSFERTSKEMEYEEKTQRVMVSTW